MKQFLKLPDRLAAIAGYIDEGSAVADIGTDHGFLPVYLAQNGLSRNIIASDISSSSLGSARRTAQKYGVAHMISFIAAPGLSCVGEKGADTIIIAGVGGETIAGILADAPWTNKHNVKLILQPQTKTAGLCAWLRENGYVISDAKLTRDNGRFYVIIVAGGGISESVLEPELEMLTRLMYKKDPLFTGYLDELINKTSRILEGAKDSVSADHLNTALKLSVYLSLKEVNKNWRE